MKITILADNRAPDGLEGEHGLSMWIEADGLRILFDTGQGSALAPNAQALGIDLSTADILVLSHGHYDHTGAIEQVIRSAPDIQVYCHPGVVETRYSVHDGVVTPIQMPPESVAAIMQLPAQQLHWVRQPAYLSEHIGITGPVPRETAYEDTGGPFYSDPDGSIVDPIDDDQALWIRNRDGLVVCVGCSHSGIINILNRVRGLNNGQGIRAIIGGFHLLNASAERLDQTVAALRQLAPDSIIPCHCTGDSATALLGNAFEDRCASGSAGMSFQF